MTNGNIFSGLALVGLAVALVACAPVTPGTDSPPASVSPPALQSPPSEQPFPTAPSSDAPPGEPTDAASEPSDPDPDPDPNPSVEPSGADQGFAERAVEVAALKAAGFEDGQFLVGDEIKPGRYKTVLTAEQANPGWPGCYAEVASGGVSLDIIVNEYFESGRTILDVPDIPGAVLESQGCGPWLPVG